jgi:hypothetical protein
MGDRDTGHLTPCMMVACRHSVPLGHCALLSLNRNSRDDAQMHASVLRRQLVCFRSPKPRTCKTLLCDISSNNARDLFTCCLQTPWMQQNTCLCRSVLRIGYFCIFLIIGAVSIRHDLLVRFWSQAVYCAVHAMLIAFRACTPLPRT